MAVDHHNQLLLITGATGHQGGAVVRQTVERGFRVRALVRNPQKPAARKLENEGVEIAQGDFDDRASLDRALEGCHGVFSVQDFHSEGYVGEVRQGKAIADAAKAAGVRHFVYSSVGNANRNTGISHFESKWEIEQYLSSIRIPHTVLRPVFFYYNYEAMRPSINQGALAMPLSPDTKLCQVSEDDYGRIVAMVFEDPETYLGRQFDVASSQPTMREVVQTFTRVLGRPVEYQRLQWDDFKKQAGEELTRMFQWFEAVGYHVDFGDLWRRFGDLTDLETYLRQHGWGTASTAPATAQHAVGS
ncbi:MAG TPA: NmrA/HSCARG family protein [Planctomycetaceae bacterium]|jgi:uncharacterized protein YbjT (DUF2867 family)|nr:NmrA/HSCARG family protein [Planctomycetaceae bacterium]